MPNPSATDSEPQAVCSLERFRFELPARLEYRDAARAFLAHICDQLIRANRLPSEVALRVVSAFVEGFNNAVIHGHEDVRSGPIQVGMEVADTHLEVRITGHGRPFAPEQVPEPDLDALPEGGLGLFIMRNFMDQVRYERNGDMNVLIMTKQIDRAESPSESAKTVWSGEE